MWCVTKLCRSFVFFCKYRRAGPFDVFHRGAVAKSLRDISRYTFTLDIYCFTNLTPDSSSPPLGKNLLLEFFRFKLVIFKTGDLYAPSSGSALPFSITHRKILVFSKTRARRTKQHHTFMPGSCPNIFEGRGVRGKISRTPPPKIFIFCAEPAQGHRFYTVLVLGRGCYVRWRTWWLCG